MLLLRLQTEQARLLLLLLLLGSAEQHRTECRLALSGAEGWRREDAQRAGGRCGGSEGAGRRGCTA
jgi:hypothetical protein